MFTSFLNVLKTSQEIFTIESNLYIFPGANFLIFYYLLLIYLFNELRVVGSLTTSSRFFWTNERFSQIPIILLSAYKSEA